MTGSDVDESRLRGDLISLSVSTEQLIVGAITYHTMALPSARGMTRADADRINFLAGDVLGRVSLGDKVAILRTLIKDRELEPLAPTLASGSRSGRWVNIRNIAAHHTLVMGQATTTLGGGFTWVRPDPTRFRSLSRGKAYDYEESPTELVEMFQVVREEARLVYVAVLDQVMPDWNADGQTIE